MLSSLTARFVSGVALSGLLLAALPASAQAAEWPDVKASAKSAMPACVTPGRLMALAKSRNSGLDKRFEAIAVDYMKHGEELGLRWDYAFFQMLVETNNLSFAKGVRGGAVKPEQFNFGGIGSMGGNEAGESFKNVSDGVRAHLEHVTVYAGIGVENAVSDRTRRFQTWPKFTEIRDGLKKPATFSDVIGHLAPKSKAYVDGVSSIADTFNSDFCKKADPKPDLMAGVRAKPQADTRQADAAAEKPQQVAEAVKKAIETGKTDNSTVRTNLGAGLAKAKAAAPDVKIINQPEAPVAESKPAAVQQVAAAAGAAAKAQVPKTSEPKQAVGPKCRVWTASYGRDKALIIKAVVDGMTNYTVLDVNAGQETREADAYIAAYAKGGKIEAQFGSQSEALDKAFDLCPEG